MVRYRAKPDRVAENEELVREVYAELDRVRPDGFNYATYKLDDGVSFVHLAMHEDDDNPLARIEAFGRFQSGVGDRCDDPPVVTELEEVGSFRFPAG
jgi:hypothetical protein